MDDLYRDLRDRRLLPLVGLLLVAIVAVPIALSASPSPSASEGPDAAVVPADAPEAQAAVLAEDPGLRDYRQRLDALKVKNPFKQQFQTSGLAGATVEGTTQDTGTVSQSSGTAGGSETSTSTSSGSGAVDTPTPSSTTPEAGETTTADSPKPKFYSWKLTVRYGAAGDAQERDNVKVMDFLRPVGVFVGASFDARRAFFFLSSDIVSASGGGDCEPAPTDCQFLTLKEGKAEDFAYQPVGAGTPTIYTLVLEDIKVIKLKEPPEFK